MTDVKQWYEKLYKEIVEGKEATEENANKFFDAYWKFPAKEFIDFHLNQLPAEKDLINSSASQYWRDLSSNTLELSLATREQDFEKSVLAAYYMGIAIGRLQGHIDTDTLMFSFKAAQEKHQREIELNNKQDAHRLIKEMTQLIAQQEWKKDKRQEVRTSEMAERVWPILCESLEGLEVEKYLPLHGPSGLNKYLRPIAPEYAKKGGAPRKSKK